MQTRGTLFRSRYPAEGSIGSPRAQRPAQAELCAYGSAIDNECTNPDTCNDSGVCLPNHATLGSPCAGGACSDVGVCDCASERITAGPYGDGWATSSETPNVLDLSCEVGCTGIPDHVAVFAAPATSTYHFTASALATPSSDARLAILAGGCASLGAELACNDDIRMAWIWTRRSSSSSLRARR